MLEMHSNVRFPSAPSRFILVFFVSHHSSFFNIDTYEVVTAWVDPRYRSNNIAILLYAHVFQRVPSHLGLVLVDVLEGSYQRSYREMVEMIAYTVTRVTSSKGKAALSLLLIAYTPLCDSIIYIMSMLLPFMLIYSCCLDV